MNCPNCDEAMEEFTEVFFSCNNCDTDVDLCKICKMIMENSNSDICGHPTCIEKKAEMLFG